MRITTVSETDAADFDNAVNRLLIDRWELHGSPSMTTVPEHDTWDGEPYSVLVTTYVQVLKKES